MGEQRRSRLAAILLEAEPIAQLDGYAVPVGAFEDLESMFTCCAKQERRECTPPGTRPSEQRAECPTAM